MINLQKGQKISLSKESQGLKDIMIGLGWDEAKQSKSGGLFSRRKSTNNIDCDASAILLDSNGKCISNRDVVYFGNLEHSSGAVIHMGDNLTGAGDGDDEQIKVYLQDVPSKYQRIVFTVTIYQAIERRQHFGMIKNAFIRIVDDDTKKELCRYNLSDDTAYDGKTAMIFGELYRYKNEWKFSAIGEATNDGGIVQMANRFM